MGTYIMSGDHFITNDTQTTMDILDIVSPWRIDQWKSKDEAKLAEDKADYEAAPEDEKTTWWFGYRHPGQDRRPGLMNLEIFVRASIDVPRTLDEFIEWGLKNMPVTNSTSMFRRDPQDQWFTQQQLDRCMAAIDKAIKLNDHPHVC